MRGNINDKLLRVVKVCGRISTITYNVENVNSGLLNYSRYNLKIISDDDMVGLKLGGTQNIIINDFIDTTRIEASADMSIDFFVLLGDNDNVEELKQRYKRQMLSAIIRRSNSKTRKKTWTA